MRIKTPLLRTDRRIVHPGPALMLSLGLALAAAPGAAGAECRFGDAGSGVRLYVLQSESDVRDEVAAKIAERLDVFVEEGAPVVRPMGDADILVEVPVAIADDIAIAFTRGELSFHTVVERGAGADGAHPGRIIASDGDGERYLLEAEPVLTGRHLVDAQPGFGTYSAEPVVNFRFDEEGARIFGEYTAANIGTAFALVLDGKVLTAPIIRSPIPGGSGQIEGGFTVREASELAVVLRVGALPGPVAVVRAVDAGPLARTRSTHRAAALVELGPKGARSPGDYCAEIGAMTDADVSIQTLADGGLLVWVARDKSETADAAAGRVMPALNDRTVRSIDAAGADAVAARRGIVSRVRRLFE